MIFSNGFLHRFCQRLPSLLPSKTTGMYNTNKSSPLLSIDCFIRKGTSCFVNLFHLCFVCRTPFVFLKDNNIQQEALMGLCSTGMVLWLLYFVHKLYYSNVDNFKGHNPVMHGRIWLVSKGTELSSILNYYQSLVTVR